MQLTDGFAARNRRRGPRRVVYWTAMAAVIGCFGLAAGPGARADAAGGGADRYIFTHVALTGDVYHGSDPPPDPVDFTPPPCWLEPNNGEVYGIPSAYTADNFALYIGQLQIHSVQSRDGTGEVLKQIYELGQGADPIVGITAPPYNKSLGNAGWWYEILCGQSQHFGDYFAFKAQLGATKDGEEWFWFNNGAPPKGQPILDPELLAEYAAANTVVTPQWPTMSPAAKQTVNLATLFTNAAGTNGYRRYRATAALIDPPMSSTVFATPASITFTADTPGVISPSSVKCTFRPNGQLDGNNCQLTFLKSTSTGWVLHASTMWNLTWNGPQGQGWVHHLGPIDINSPPIIVQEIQTIVGH